MKTRYIKNFPALERKKKCITLVLIGGRTLRYLMREKYKCLCESFLILGSLKPDILPESEILNLALEINEILGSLKFKMLDHVCST